MITYEGEWTPNIILSLYGSFKCWKIAINVRNRIFRMRWDVLVNQSEQVENVVVVVRNVVGRTINSSSRRNVIKKNTLATISWHPFLVVNNFFTLVVDGWSFQPTSIDGVPAPSSLVKINLNSSNGWTLYIAKSVAFQGLGPHSMLKS